MQPHIQWVHESLPSDVNRPWREAHHLPPSRGGSRVQLHGLVFNFALKQDIYRVTAMLRSVN